MTTPNRLMRQLATLRKLPGSQLLTTLVLRNTVPFLGTAGLRFIAAEPEYASLALANRRRVHNHIGGVHACAAALLAEATSGLALSCHLPDGRVPLLTHMHIDYTQRMRGGLLATARIDEAAQARVLTDPRGETEIVVEVQDQSGASPLVARLTWAWRPTKKNEQDQPRHAHQAV